MHAVIIFITYNNADIINLMIMLLVMCHLSFPCNVQSIAGIPPEYTSSKLLPGDPSLELLAIFKDSIHRQTSFYWILFHFVVIAHFKNYRFVATLHWTKSIDVIFSTAFTHFISLCYILIIHTIFTLLHFYLYYIWCHTYFILHTTCHICYS